jgi:hypothetical protein
MSRLAGHGRAYIAILKSITKISISLWLENTVKSLYNNHPRAKFVTLLTSGRCSEVNVHINSRIGTPKWCSL